MLIQSEELLKKLHLQNNIVLCCLLKPVGVSQPVTEAPEFIPASRIFDIDEFSISDSEFPHTLLNAEDFAAMARKLGIDNSSSIVVYDNIGIYSSPRVWFNLTLMGCTKVSLLNGGFPNWKNHGYPISLEPETIIHSGDFTAHQVSNMVANKEEVFRAISNPNCNIIDVRSSGRFFGKEPEPRKGVRSGHIPGSINIPFSNFTDGHCFKQKEDLLRIFIDAGCHESDEIIFSCGSGVTACIGYVSAYLCGYTKIKVYDGSWAEWGAIASLPIEI